MEESNGSMLPPMKAQDYSEAEDWSGYFGAVLGKPARDTLIAALQSFAREGVTDGFAVDVAAGEGRDTLELLQQGWRVLATDAHPEAFNHLWPRVPEELKARLKAVEVDFAEMQVPACDLVNASFALPFCQPRDFPGLWCRLVTAIRREAGSPGSSSGTATPGRRFPAGRTTHATRCWSCWSASRLR